MARTKRLPIPLHQKIQGPNPKKRADYDIKYNGIKKQRIQSVASQFEELKQKVQEMERKLFEKDLYISTLHRLIGFETTTVTPTMIMSTTTTSPSPPLKNIQIAIKPSIESETKTKTKSEPLETKNIDNFSLSNQISNLSSPSSLNFIPIFNNKNVYSNLPPTLETKSLSYTPNSIPPIHSPISSHISTSPTFTLNSLLSTSNNCSSISTVNETKNSNLNLEIYQPLESNIQTIGNLSAQTNSLLPFSKLFSDFRSLPLPATSQTNSSK